MQLLPTARIAILTMLSTFPSFASAQTRTAACEYFSSNGSKLVSGPCLVTQLSAPSDPTYAIKVTLPSVELEIRYLKRQGEYHRWTVNGSSAAAYEINRDHICGFTDDLSVSLCIKEGDAAKSAVAESPASRPPLAASGRPFYVGRWYSDNQRLCRGRAGETEGLITYTERQVIGYEERCDILTATPASNRIELQLECASEGMTSRGREVVQLLRDGQLSRTTFDGRRPSNSQFRRCP